MIKQNKNESQVLLNSESCSWNRVFWKLKKLDLRFCWVFISVSFIGCKVNNAPILCPLGWFLLWEYLPGEKVSRGVLNRVGLLQNTWWLLEPSSASLSLVMRRDDGQFGSRIGKLNFFKMNSRLTVLTENPKPANKASVSYWWVRTCGAAVFFYSTFSCRHGYGSFTERTFIFLPASLYFALPTPAVYCDLGQRPKPSKAVLGAWGSHGKYYSAKRSFWVESHPRPSFGPLLASPHSDKSRFLVRLDVVVNTANGCVWNWLVSVS